MQDVTALLQVLAAPPILQAELSNIGITQQWLNDNAKGALRGASGCEFTQEHKALLLSNFTSLQEVNHLLPDLLGLDHTDDYPFVTVEILRNGETVWQFESSSQSQLFMLPWVVTTPKPSFTSYNAGISRAVAGLLPEQFVNRERIAGKGLEHELGFRIATRLLDFCEATVCKPCLK